MRFTFASLALPSALLVAVACGSSGSDDNAASSGGASSGNGSSGGGASSTSGGGASSSGADAKPPPVPKDFPLVTPSVGGYKLEPIYSGSNDVYVPAAVAWPKVAGAAPFVLERQGKIVRLNPNRTEVLDFSGDVRMESEAGAVGMALHPQFGDGTGAKPYAYTWYNTPGMKQRLVRWTWNAASQNFDGGSKTVLVEVSEFRGEHNGGRVAFGPDGFLYFGNGDDITTANHQTLTNSLFAGIFRIDVDMQGGAVSHSPPRQPSAGYSQGYFIPNDNPFVGVANANEEFYALGLRNPFSFSFDRMTGQLWAGDVGDSFREEVNQIVKGGNYEWPYKEAELVEGATPTTIGTAQGPKTFYTHSSMGNLTAIFGGFVYRGKAMPELVGKYIFSDWPSSRVWMIDPSKSPATPVTLVDNDFGNQPLAFAEDNDGEIYMAVLGGISKLVPDNTKDLIPKTLTETKIWKDLANAELNSEFVPYEINSPLWSDAAAKKRFISVPPGKQVTLDQDGKLVFPVGTRFVKMFDLPANVKPKNRTQRLEVRVLVVGDKATYGLTYKWNADGTDGDLVTDPIEENIEDTSNGQTRTWHFPNFGQCWSCHREENRVLGFNPRELNLVRADGTKQLDALAAVGVFDPMKISTFPDGLPKPSDTSKTLEERALAYLAANCSGCHHEGNSFTGGEQTWHAEPGVALANRGLIDAPHHNTPMAKALNLVNSPLISPGNPANSILLQRIKATDERVRMPPLGRNMVDPDGAALIEAWIASMQ